MDKIIEFDNYSSAMTPDVRMVDDSGAIDAILNPFGFVLAKDFKTIRSIDGDKVGQLEHYDMGWCPTRLEYRSHFKATIFSKARISPLITKNQSALLSKLVLDGFYLQRTCDDGYALWDRRIKYGQGRTPANAVAKRDIDALIEADCIVIKSAMTGDVIVTSRGIKIAQFYDGPDYVPSDEGYRGIHWRGIL